MRLDEFSFANVQTIRRTCVCYGQDMNKVVSRRIDVYRMEQVTDCPELEGFYLSITDLSNGKIFNCWTECGDNLVKHARFYEGDELAKITEVLLRRRKYLGLEGFKQLLSETEQAGGFIDNAKIIAIGMSGERELALHYSAYRDDYLARKEAREREELLEKAKRDAEEEQERKRLEDTQITNAEKAIRSHEWVKNDMCGDDCVILKLFDRHEIHLPGRTKGNIRRCLKSIYYREDLSVSVIWQKSKPHLGCSESVFNYLTTLCRKVCA